jgi:hypothetical protein
VNDLYDAGFYRLDLWRDSSNPSAVAHKEITIDGDASDWSGLAAQLSDPAGDGGIYDGLDIIGITIAQGITNLFVKIDRVGTQMAPTNEYSFIDVHLGSGGRGKSYNLQHYQGWYGYANTVVFDSTDDSNWISVASGNEIQINTNSSSLEIAVPLEAFDRVDRYSLDFYAHSSSNGFYVGNGDDADKRTVVIMPY